MHRREFLAKAGLSLAAASGAAAFAAAPAAPAQGCSGLLPEFASFPLVRAQTDRIIALTVCTRPFRASGPRIETERLGRKTIVHNYGHGGSGWSLSWGSAEMALRQVRATRRDEVAVIGCGVIGLTSAIVAQRAGLKVRIYAKDRPPDTRSTYATGNWSPNSRFCSLEGATPEVTDRWEEMARISFRAFQFMLGLPGNPIEWRDGYYLADETSVAAQGNGHNGEPEYPSLDRRLSDIVPASRVLAPGSHPFPVSHVRRYANLIFNISAYTHLLIADFLAAGGVIETREFEQPGDISRLKEKTVIHATGYGARALFGDESIIPVRGQIARLIPQPEITYGLTYGAVYMLPRRDAIIVQAQAPGDFGNADITPDRAAADRAVLTLDALNQRILANAPCR